MNIQQFTQKVSDYNENSRVWIYQADRILTNEEVGKIETVLTPFAASWAYHGERLKSNYGVLYNLFVIYVVDETVAEVAGCGLDSSVHVIQKLSKELNVDFFNRLAISFFNGDKIECIDKDCFSELIDTENWKDDNLVFNNQVNTLGKLKTNWIVPFEESWHKNFFATKDSFNFSL